MGCSQGCAAVRVDRQCLRVGSALLLPWLVACHAPAPERCLQSALQQPQLQDGRVAFSTRAGQVHFADQYGGSKARSALPLTMASLTKPLVAAAIRDQIDDGRLHLQDRLSSVLPGRRFDAATGGLTLQQLLQHQAGFDASRRDPMFIDPVGNCRLAMAEVQRRPPEQVPGRAIHYSNVGYCLLGEVLLRAPDRLPTPLLQALRSPRGAAGGWRASLGDTHAALRATLPVVDLPSAVQLTDGSYYGYGWRHWPPAAGQPAWTHFGRLPGMLSLAATDGRDRLLVAHFSGDPTDVERASQQAITQLWRCVQQIPDPQQP